MVIVAVTGQIGSGKSTVCKLLAARGGCHVDADQVAREITAPGSPAYAEILQEFGQAVLGPEGKLDRRRLAAIVFEDETARQRLNAITHPRVIRSILEKLEELRRSGTEVVVVEAALLNEAGAVPFWDHLIWVSASDGVRRERLEKAGMEPADAERRIRVQADRVRPPSKCFHAIDNSGTCAATEAQLGRLWGELGLGCGRAALDEG